MSKMWLIGLDKNQVEKRRALYGINEISQKNRFKNLKLLLHQWMSPLIWILGAAAMITGFMQDFVDTALISLALALNTVVGFVQEFRVERSLEALKEALSNKAEVIRDGKRMTIYAREIVPGDILFVSNKHKVAADGIVVMNENLETMEAVLTGESASVKKTEWPEVAKMQEIEEMLVKWRTQFATLDNQYKVMMGTEVKAGVAQVLVVNTGMETQFGMIAENLREVKEEKVPLQRKMDVLTARLAWGVLGVAALVVVSSVVAGETWMMAFPLAVALAVAALPEGLALSLTLILAIGTKRILSKGGIVKRLAVAEALGSVEVICIDKTGTLTEGVMRVVQAVTNLKEEKVHIETEKMVLAAVLCNDLRDPLELAMDEWANKQLVALSGHLKVGSYERLDSKPFNSQDKLIITLHSWGEKMKRLFVSGAPEEVLSRTNLDSDEKEKWLDKFKELGLQGYRLVGFGGKEKQMGEKIDPSEINKLDWLGVLVYADPIRFGVRDALEKIVRAGIDLKVITGDYKETGMAVLNQLGLLGLNDEKKVLTGNELDLLSQDELIKKIDEIVLFARTSPSQKLKIVEALQAKGKVVAMTGDGVNDAPAIKKADIGIVVEGATEVAKETADLILINSSFQTILEAVEEGRSILVNFRKVILFLLADALVGVIVVIGSLAFKWPLPILASQILWINLISDSLPYFSLTLEPKTKGLLKLRPKDFSGQLLTPKMTAMVLVISFLSGMACLLVFGWYRFGLGSSVELSRTMVMTMLGVNSLFYIFATRSLDRPVWERQKERNPWLIGSVIIGCALILAAIYIPQMSRLLELEALKFNDWWWIFAGTVVVIGGAEVVKST